MDTRRSNRSSAKQTKDVKLKGTISENKLMYNFYWLHIFFNFISMDFSSFPIQ